MIFLLWAGLNGNKQHETVHWQQQQQQKINYKEETKPVSFMKCILFCRECSWSVWEINISLMDGHRMEIYTQTFIAYEGFVELKTKFLIDCFTNYTGWLIGPTYCGKTIKIIKLPSCTSMT